jgi:hypothetical protein
MSRKRQQTIAKLARERLVKERRALKLEKKQAAREAKANGESPTNPVVDAADADAGTVYRAEMPASEESKD